jgi:hypothetical protein
MADNSMALVLPCLPNTTYDLPALILPLGSARPLAQVALLSEASQWVILVATQSPAQAMLTAMVWMI